MKVVAVIAIAVAVGVVVVLMTGGSTFGVESANPLGVAMKIDADAKDQGLTPGGKPEPAVLRNVFGADLARRKDVTWVQYLGRAANYPHWVIVALDKSGKVVAIAGNFRSEMFEFTKRSTNRTGNVLSRLWLEVVGAEPVFETKLFGANAKQDYLVAQARNGVVTGRWEKNWGGGIRISAQVADRVVLKVQ